MDLFRQRKQQRVSRRASLEGVPVLHQNVEVIEIDGETVTLKIEFVRGNSPIDWLRPKEIKRNYELDEFGSFVIRQVGEHVTVMDIIRAFEKKFKLCHREAELGVVAFLKMLMKRKVLSVVIE